MSFYGNFMVTSRDFHCVLFSLKNGIVKLNHYPFTTGIQHPFPDLLLIPNYDKLAQNHP